MSIIQILFFALSALAIISAVMVLISKNPIHSVLWLILVFFAISGHYILLNAQFLAIVNIIVYAGAIMVLFLFVMMLMNVKKDKEPQKQLWVKLTGVIAGGAMRALFEALGVQDVVSKSLGSSNPHNMIKATFYALTALQSPRMIAAKRGKRVSEIFSNRQLEAQPEGVSEGGAV
jgi:NADH:ubiquinone oxidoreductase subunit 6 (subunit J)